MKTKDFHDSMFKTINSDTVMDACDTIAKAIVADMRNRSEEENSISFLFITEMVKASIVQMVLDKTE